MMDEDDTHPRSNRWREKVIQSTDDGKFAVKSFPSCSIAETNINLNEGRIVEPATSLIDVEDDTIQFGFKSNHAQLILHWTLAVLIGISLKMTTFSEAMIAAEMGVDNYVRETSFLVAFGFTKALSNLFVGWASDKYDRRVPHIIGWFVGIILSLQLIAALDASNDLSSGDSRNNWERYVVANIFLGAQQGMTWTTNIFMFIDILGPDHRALASGISNSTGYISSAIATYVASAMTARSVFMVVLLSTSLGFLLSAFRLKDTKNFVKREMIVSRALQNDLRIELFSIRERAAESNCELERRTSNPTLLSADLTHSEKPAVTLSFGNTFLITSWFNRSTAIICFAGLVTNLITSFAWGLVLIWGKQQNLRKLQLAHISSAFTFAKALSQIVFSYISDRYSRKSVLLAGFSVAVIGLSLTAVAGTSVSLSAIYIYLLVGGIIIGCGIGSVYCVMTGAISDHTQPENRASAIGTYKLWRDSGYAFGGLLTGLVADLSGGSFVITTLVVEILVIVLVVLIFCSYIDKVSSLPSDNKATNNSGNISNWPELQSLKGVNQ